MMLDQQADQGSPQAEQQAGEGQMEVEVPPVQAAQPAPPREDDRFSGSYTWRLRNVSRFSGGDHTAAPAREYSPNFELGTYTWRLLVFPKGNQKQSLALYLDAPESSCLPRTMCPTAVFTLTIVNQRDPSRSWTKETSHMFVGDASDWGFTETVHLQDIYNPNNGWIVDDSLEFIVRVQVQKDEGYSSRKETNFVGLKNQGATCYMNSLLQYLYNLPYFRKAVYHMPTSETEEYSKTMPLALQSLFFKLQYSRTTVATKDLTKSFGWNTQDAFMQHDVQELNRVLCEKLEEKMKGTRVERAINYLFEGNTVNYIRCLNVEYTSERKEVFMDLQLDVKGCRNIYDSFDKYTEVEIMNGPNQYMAENYGLQDAEKGVKFHSFPPVLQLQLKRFEYDFQRDAMVKINDRYEFYDTLDLDRDNRKYMDSTADPHVRNTYLLHSVLVHSGGVHGGHYYAFVRPDRHTWLRFDDERVTKELSHKAMEEQFGDDEPAHAYGSMRFPKHSNAYMLVYVRESDWDKIMCTTGKEDLPEPVRMRFESELRDKERRQQEKMEAHMFINVKIATDQDIRDQIAAGRAFDLVDHDLLAPGRGALRVPKTTRVGDIKRKVEEVLGVPVHKQRYWLWGPRPNGTIRALRPLWGTDEEKLLDLKEFGVASKNAIMEIRLYLETPRSGAHNLLEGDLYNANMGDDSKPGSEVFLYAKMYLPHQGKLQYVGRGFMPVGSTIGEVARAFAHMAGLPEGTEVDVFEEIKAEPTVMVQQLKKKMLVCEIKSLMHGDILIIQPRVAVSEEGEGGEAALQLPLHPNIQSYLQYVRQRRIVLFKPLIGEEPSSGPNLAKSQSTTTLATAAGAAAPVPAPASTGATTEAAAGGGGGGAAAGQAPGSTGAAGAAAPPSGGRQTPPPPQLPSFQLELRDDMTYEDVTQRVAAQLGMLPPETGSHMLRLTQHNQYTHAPQRQPLKQRETHTLHSMLSTTSMFQGQQAAQRNLSGAHHPGDILYYEVLDMPLEQLEQLRTVKVYFHRDSGEAASEHLVRVKREATVAALLAEVARQLGPSYDNKELRLLLWHSGKLFKMLSPGNAVDSIGDDSSWRLRVEAVPQEEAGLEFAPDPMRGERLLHCYHCHVPQEKQSAVPVIGPLPPAPSPHPLVGSPQPFPHQPPSQQQPLMGPNSMEVSTQGADSPPTSTAGTGGGLQLPTGAGREAGVQAPLPAAPQPPPQQLSPSALTHFGDPLLVRCGPQDTLGTIRARLQAKLGASDEELAKWRWALCSNRYGYEPLHDESEPVGARLQRQGVDTATVGNEHPYYLAMEHEDDKPRRPVVAASRFTYERPVKIYT